MKKILPAFLAVLALACFLRFPDTVSEAALSAMSTTARRLLPALFPYMAISSLIVRRSLLAPLCRFLPVRRPLGMPDAAAGVLLTGWIAGFPVGASGAAQLYRQGALSKRDAERLAAVSSAASPAFLVSAVGGMWEDTRFGWVLLAVNIAALLLFGVSTAPREERRTASAAAVPPSAPSFAADLSRAVSDAGSSCLGVTAFIAFFRILSAVAGRLFPLLRPVFSLLLEFSEGASFGASVGGAAGAAMTGFAVGFSGLCVLTQIAAQLSDAGLSLRRTVLSRIPAAVVLAAVGAAYASIFPMDPAADAAMTAPAPSFLPVLLWLAVLIAAKFHVGFHKFSARA